MENYVFTRIFILTTKNAIIYIIIINIMNSIL